MKTIISVNDVNLGLDYNKSGVLESVEDLNSGNPLTIEFFGGGKDIVFSKQKTLIAGETRVLDARYCRIVELDIYVPRLLFVAISQQ